MRFLWLGLLLAACAQQPAPEIASAPQCDISWSALRSEAPSHVRIIEIPHPAAFLGAFNATPPASDISADRVFAVHGGGYALLFFVTGDCLSDHAAMPWDDFERIVGGAES